MADEPRVIWTSVPVDSTFELECDGDKNTYDVSALVSFNKTPRPNLEKNDINPGPARIAIDGTKQRWEILPSLIPMQALQKAINMKACIKDKDGKVVNLPDGNGNELPAEAAWVSGKTAGSLLEVTIQIRSVRS